MANPGQSMLRRQDGGDAVRHLQRALVRTKGFSPDGIDGDFGPATEQAVKNHQSGSGLAVDGIVGPATWGSLPNGAADPMLRAGCKGGQVVKLQSVLNTEGSYAGPADGIFGPATTAAVKHYQTSRSLSASGVVDDRTWFAPAGAAGATLDSLCALVPA